jgi:hypothetical protein
MEVAKTLAYYDMAKITAVEVLKYRILVALLKLQTLLINLNSVSTNTGTHMGTMTFRRMTLG